MAIAMDPKNPVDTSTDLAHPRDVFTDSNIPKVVAEDPKVILFDLMSIILLWATTV